MPPKRPSLAPILAVNFVGTLGFSIVVPFLVFLVTRWGGNAVVYGLIGATYSAFQLIGAPVLGRWSDRFGRRRILLLSQLGTMVSWVIFLVAFAMPEQTLLPLIVLFIARAIDGLTGGNVSVANAYLADITDDDQRSTNFGRMSLAGNLGFIVGPALAGLLGATVYGEIVPVSAALAISVVASLIIAFGLTESRPCAMHDVPEQANARKVSGEEQRPCYKLTNDEPLGMLGVLRLKHIPVLLTIYFLVMLGFSYFYASFPVHAVRQLQWTVAQTGSFFAVLSLLMVLVQGPVLARAAKLFSDRSLVVAGSVILSGGFLSLMSSAIAPVYAAAALIALGNGLMWPSVMALISKRAGEAHQGAVQGFAGSVGAVASIVGLIAGGFLYSELGGWIFAVSGGTLVTVALIALTGCRRDVPATSA